MANTVECPECNGVGIVENLYDLGYEHPVRCEACDGFGEVENEDEEED